MTHSSKQRSLVEKLRVSALWSQDCVFIFNYLHFTLDRRINPCLKHSGFFFFFSSEGDYMSKHTHVESTHSCTDKQNVILNKTVKIKTTAADSARPLWITVTWIHEHGDKKSF